MFLNQNEHLMEIIKFLEAVILPETPLMYKKTVE